MGGRSCVTGDVKAAWRDALAVDMSLASRWLDLDRIAGLSEATLPLDSIVPLAIACATCCRERAARARSSPSIRPISAGDAISNLRLALARTQDKLQVEELQLGMPGGSRASCRAWSRACPRRRPSTARRPARQQRGAVPGLGIGQRVGVRCQGRRRVRGPLAPLDLAGPLAAARYFRRPVGNGDPRNGALSLGGTARAVAAGREPAARCAGLHPRGSQPRRHPRRHPAWSAAAGERPGAGWRPAAGLAQRPDRRSDPRQRRAAPRRIPHLPRRHDGDRAEGRTPARAAARCRATKASAWSSRAISTMSPRAPRACCAA